MLITNTYRDLILLSQGKDDAAWLSDTSGGWWEPLKRIEPYVRLHIWGFRVDPEVVVVVIVLVLARRFPQQLRQVHQPAAGVPRS